VLNRQVRKLKITEEYGYGKLDVDKEPLKVVGAVVAYYETEIDMKQKFIEELVRKRGERSDGEGKEEKKEVLEEKP
jgi:hypothetical protein